MPKMACFTKITHLRHFWPILTIAIGKKIITKMGKIHFYQWVFRAKIELFLVLPKFDWKKIFQKFQKKMVQEG
jgi:hypothetical protein